ncbi:MAG: LPD38 domain-containing protein, partial [Deltaproteobacteria bacterium]|nr:LPD38 domain-containing protein [Deltaproteobacteria bacterium]
WGRITGDLVGYKGGLKVTKDAPESAGQRHYVRGTMAMALARLQKDHPQLTMSDLQAVLWYPEKDLYAMHGVNDESGKPTDYEIETAAYAKLKGINDAQIEAAGIQPDETAGRGAAGERKQPGVGQAREGARERGAAGAGGDGEEGGAAAQLSPKKQGQVDVVGVHFSAGARTSLSGAYFGTGAKGAEAVRVRSAKDGRLRSRIYAYVNTGSGVTPERYVGGVAHTIPLQNLYDADSDPPDLTRLEANAFESAVLDAGFSGYLVRSGKQAIAALIGPASLDVAVENKGTRYRGEDLAVPPAPTYSPLVQLTLAIANSKLLPGGQLTGDEWRANAHLQKLLGDKYDASKLEGDTLYYKSEVARLVGEGVQMSPKQTLETDMRDQSAWLDQRARDEGYESVDALPPERFTELAAEWRAEHPRISFSPKTRAMKKWLEGSAVRDVVYHGTSTDFTAFNTDDTTELGAHFGTTAHANDRVGAYTDSRVIPVYLNLKNPLRLIDEGTFAPYAVAGQLADLGILPQEQLGRFVNKHTVGVVNKEVPLSEELKRIIERAGYDGVVYLNRREGYDGSAVVWADAELNPELSDAEWTAIHPGGGDSYIAFHPKQIKSVFNERPDDSAQFSPKIVGDSKRPYTPEQRRFFKHTGREIEKPSSADRFKALKQDLGMKMAQGLVDQFAPLKALSPMAYMLARLSKGSAGALEALLHHGKLRLRGGAFDADRSGGFIQRVGIPLHGELEDFLWWVAANRAERLTAQDRERLFSRSDIAAGKSLASGNLATEYTLQSGQKTRVRAQAYADSLKKFEEFNRNALDMAEQSGLIDPASRKIWENEFYVPFYRVSEEEGGFVGANIGNALVRQRAFKHLKGGEQKLHSDLLANTIANWAHLIDASAKNRAAKASLEAAANMGVAVEADAATVASMGRSISKSGVWFMDGGVKRHYLVEDPFVLTAITSLEYSGMKGPLMDAMSTMKHVLTVGVTASPFFKVKNLIRDSLQAIAVAPIGANPLTNIREGIAASEHSTQTYVSALASGGLIRFGTMLEGRMSDRVRQLIKSGVKETTILNSDSKLRAMYDRYLEPAVIAYNELGNRSEEITRAALYKQLTDKGMSHAEASLMARDLMDFSLQGSWSGIRFLTQVVPFMNARMQGIYKLGRGAVEDPRRFAAVIGATAMFSIALMAAYGDDDDWKKREEWDRDNFWWFKVGGTAFRIPKPFEVGAIATLAERGLEYFTSPEMTGERFRKVTLDILANNLSMNPVPQLLKPVVDIYANKDSFTGRPIETLGMERLQPDYRFNARTSMLARAAGTAGQTVAETVGADFISPLMIDHALRGYFGWLGSFIVGTADLLARPMTGEAERPAGDLWKLTTGNMIAELPTDQSRYVSQMYEQARVIEQAYGTYRSLLKQGKGEEAREFLEDNRDKLTKYRGVQQVKRAEGQLNERIRIIEQSTLDPEAKRVAIAAIAAQKDRVARLVK